MVRIEEIIDDNENEKDRLDDAPSSSSSSTPPPTVPIRKASLLLSAPAAATRSEVSTSREQEDDESEYGCPSCQDSVVMYDTIVLPSGIRVCNFCATQDEEEEEETFSSSEGSLGKAKSSELRMRQTNMPLLDRFLIQNGGIYIFFAILLGVLVRYWYNTSNYSFLAATGLLVVTAIVDRVLLFVADRKRFFSPADDAQHQRQKKVK